MINPVWAMLLILADPAPQPVTMSAAQFAEAIQGVVGQTYEGGVRIARIHAEDQTLVVTLDGPAGWRQRLSGDNVSRLFIDSFCQDRDFEYFVNGNLMRVDTTEGGSASRPGIVLRACPAAPPAQHPQ